MAITQKCKDQLGQLVYYAVDKASPYALAMYASTDSLQKIESYRLTQLAITDQGVANMWLWINAHCMPCAKPVPPDVASNCTTVAEVVKAVEGNAA